MVADDTSAGGVEDLVARKSLMSLPDQCLSDIARYYLHDEPFPSGAHHWPGRHIENLALLNRRWYEVFIASLHTTLRLDSKYHYLHKDLQRAAWSSSRRRALRAFELRLAPNSIEVTDSTERARTAAIIETMLPLLENLERFVYCEDIDVLRTNHDRLNDLLARLPKLHTIELRLKGHAMTEAAVVRTLSQLQTEHLLRSLDTLVLQFATTKTKGASSDALNALLAKPFVGVKRLDIGPWTEAAQWPYYLAKVFPSVTHFTLPFPMDKISLSNHDRALATWAPQLITLRLEHDRSSKFSVHMPGSADDALRQFMPACCSLQELHLSKVPVSAAVLEALPDSIVELHIDADSNFPSALLVALIAARWRKLSKVVLSSTKMPPSAADAVQRVTYVSPSHDHWLVWRRSEPVESYKSRFWSLWRHLLSAMLRAMHLDNMVCTQLRIDGVGAKARYYRRRQWLGV